MTATFTVPTELSATEPPESRGFARDEVRLLVANPGMVKARMLRLGSLSSSMARAHTISACVESRPPETPMISFLLPVARMRVVRPSTWMRYTSSQRKSRFAASLGT